VNRAIANEGATAISASNNSWRAACTAFLTETRFDCSGVYRSPSPSTRLLKLCRYLSTRLETAPPKLEVSFRVTHVLWSESAAKETTPRRNDQARGDRQEYARRASAPERKHYLKCRVILLSVETEATRQNGSRPIFARV
jgi:hypothetical protein